MAHKRNGAVLRVAKRRYWREADAQVMVEAWRRTSIRSRCRRASGSARTAATRYADHRRRPRRALPLHPDRRRGDLTDVLRKLAAGWPQRRLDELLPDRWQTLYGQPVEP